MQEILSLGRLKKLNMYGLGPDNLFEIHRLECLEELGVNGSKLSVKDVA